MPNGSRRFHPLALRADRRIARPRLVQALAGRFDARLTLVTAGAGHGKSTALAEAIANNHLAPAGRDILLAATPADADPTVFLAGVAEVMNLEPVADQDTAIEAIANRLWAMAPTEVAIIVDDAHHLNQPDAVAAVHALIDALPANGHLLLASRTTLPLQLMRLQALDLLESVEQDQLLFDHDELAELSRSRQRDDVSADQLPRLPALADLQLRVGASAGVEFLWQEVLAGFDAERLRCLSRAAVVAVLDDGLALELSGGRFTVAELTDELPMVELGEHNRCRLHSLLRQALLDRLDDQERQEAAADAARFEVNRGRLVPAILVLSEAGDAEGALEIVRRLAALPLIQLPVDSARLMINTARQLAPGSLLVEILEAQHDYGRYDREHIARFIDLARRALNEGDEELEALAIHRAVQGLEQSDELLPTDLVQRIGILATEGGFARAVDAHIGSAGALRQGDSDAARHLLLHYRDFDTHGRQAMLAERLCQLGLIEEVAGENTASEFDDRPPSGAGTFVAFAMWLRGDADPALALAVVKEMIAPTMRRALRYNQIAVLSVAAHIAIAAGDRALAGRWAEKAADLSTPDVAPGIRLYSLLADATVAWDRASDGDPADVDAFRQALDTLFKTAPIGQWPQLAHLLAVPLLYSAEPDTRPVFDRCEFGPALRTAVSAGEALVQLREHRSSTAAVTLPWRNPALLRAHVQPCDLMELAMAAVEAGAAEAAAVAEQIPDSRPLVARVAALTEQPGSEAAGRFLSTLPEAPPAPLSIRTLGGLDLDRDGAPIDDSSWRRARVRELLAYLIEHRTTTRKEVAAALWPDLDESKASANLRVNLSHLLNALEPGRPSGSPSSYLSVDGERLQLAALVELDVDQLERLMDEARQLDRDGAPADARSRYRQASELASGPYLDGIDADWTFATRVRVQSAVVEAWCRIGELTLARGEPEAASEWATKAYRLSAIDERAGRLLISCLAAAGDRVAALQTADKLVSDLREAGLKPERPTVQLTERIRRRS